MKRNKLHTANKWNQALFSGRRSNLFYGGGPVEPAAGYGQDDFFISGDTYDFSGAAPNRAPSVGLINPVVQRLSGSIPKIDPSSIKPLTPKTGSDTGLSATEALAGALAAPIGMAAYKGLSGGLSSGAGKTISSLGTTVGGALSSVPGIGPLGGAAITIGSNIVGAGVNQLIGKSINQEALNKARTGTNSLRNFTSNAATFDSIQGPSAVADVASGIYKGGLFKKSWAKRNNAALAADRADARAYAFNSTDNNIKNIEADAINYAEANYAALGGPLFREDTDTMNAIDYGFMSDYLTEKKRQNDIKNKNTGLPQVPAFMNGFAFGGDLQTHGSDWPTGLTHIQAGKSHEENPNGGVQLGIDPEGVPNLVEEGEVVYNDYVHSARIYMDDTAKKKFHLSKKQKVTYADFAKRLEKEIQERPNDPVSRAGFEKQMETLAEQQERQKQEMQAEEARAAFEALSPEEQMAVMQRLAQEGQAQQQAVEEQASMQQPSPEEEAMMQQQQAMLQDGNVPALGQAPPVMSAYGGKIYASGGVISLLKKMGYKTLSEAEKAGWKPSDFGDFKSWKDINKDSKLSENFAWTDEFSKRLTSPDMKAALALGWTPLSETLGRKWYEGDNGNEVGWTQSVGKNALNSEEFKNYVNRYKNTLGWAVENGLIKAPEKGKTVSMADIAKAMSQAPDWKKTDEWLYSDIANQAKYLGMARGLNPDEDTKFINKWSPYGTFTKGEDGQWSYNLNPNLTEAQKQAFTDLFKRTRTDNKVGVMYNNFHDPGAVTNRYLLDDKGNPTLITTDDLSGYEQLGEYTWGNPDDDLNNTAIFYREKGDTGDTTGEGAKDIAPRNVRPKYRDSLFGIESLGPVTALTMQGLGIGRPNTYGLEAAAESIGRPALATWMPRGDFAAYRPVDPWRYTTPILANSRAIDRAISNTTSPSRMAGLIANGYNTTTGLGQAAIQGEDANFNRYMAVKAHNADVHKSNQGEFGTTSRFNASALNNANSTRAQMKYNAAQAKMAADHDWYGSVYGNIGNIFEGMGKRRRENEIHNMVAEMAANELFGVMTPDSPVAGRYLQWDNQSAKGGKLKKRNHKKGLTY